MPKREPWQVAGNAAEIYERELVPAVFGPWARRVVVLAELEPGVRVLDLACGTGVVARLAADVVGRDGRVAALDLNPGMLRVAAALPQAGGAAIEWVEGNAQTLPFADGSFDVVCCQLGLQFFPDRTRIAARP
jgi:ubiquinone/menaquinone biosynthesis C-methylase UbiE